MITDSLITFTNPAITTATTYTSPEKYDTGVAADLAKGYALKIVGTMTGPWAGGDSVTVQFCSASDTAGTGEVVHFQTAALPLVIATAAGQKVQFVVPFPAPVTFGVQTPGSKHLRHLYCKFVTVGTHTGTNVGNFKVSIVMDAQDGVTYYADAISTLPNPTV